MSYKPIDRILKTVPVAAFPVNSYFRWKAVEYDVICGRPIIYWTFKF